VAGGPGWRVTYLYLASTLAGGSWLPPAFGNLARSKDSDKMNISSRFGRLIFVTSIILATFAGLALVTASPLALRSLANLHQFDWPRLSNVGQTYGAISAMLVVIGLSGVAVTVFLQVRESRHTRVQAARTRHYDLMRMALDDPVLMEVSNQLHRLPTHNERRQTIYINLLLRFWLMLWEFNDISEARLRSHAADLFETEPSRTYWRNIKPSLADTRKERRFTQIVSEEYQNSITSGRPDIPGNDGLSAEPHNVDRSALAGLGMGLAAAVALGVALIRRAARTSSGQPRELRQR
jgi:hypothetical protein